MRFALVSPFPELEEAYRDVYCSSPDRDRKGRDRKYLNVFPSVKAPQREREKLHEMTNRHQCHKPIPVLIGELNRHLQGWMNYFSFRVPLQRLL